MATPETYRVFYSEGEERTYHLCSDCSPLDENDEMIDRVKDDFGCYSCEVCGLMWVDEAGEYLDDREYESYCERDMFGERDFYLD